MLATIRFYCNHQVVMSYIHIVNVMRRANHQDLASIDLNLLVVLDALLATGSVTQTAGQLGLTQPAVSNALGRLRKRLGDPILVRTSRGMVPTPRAAGLQAPLRQALATIHQGLFADQGFDAATSTRTFALAATDYVQFLLLGPLLRQLRASAPMARVRVDAIAQRFPWRALESGELDLAVGRAPARPEGLRSRALFRDRIVCMMRKDHPAARGHLGLEDYLRLDHLDVLPIDAPGLADVYLARIGRERRVVATTPHFVVAPFALRDTDLCLTLSERVARALCRDLDLEVIDLPFLAPPFVVHAYWHERMHDDPAHRFLRSAVHEACRE
jgi:DNA-binding transcriptional LysR family regulator